MIISKIDANTGRHASVIVYNNYYKEKVETFCAKHKVVLTTLVWVLTIGIALYSMSCYPYDQMPNLFNDYFFE